MSALDDLIAGKGAPAASASNTSNLDALISGKPLAAPVVPMAAAAPALASTTPLAPVSSGYGASTQKDPFTQRPLATVPMTIPKTFMSPETTVAQVDKTRTATNFDPTIPQKINADSLKTSHIADVQTSIKEKLGGTKSEQLDHIIPVSLGGTYDMSNMRLEPTTKGVNTATDPIEAQNWRDAIDGKISVVQALQNIAKVKGITLTEDKAKNGALNNFLLNTPSILKPLAKVQGVIEGAGSFIKNLFTKSLKNKAEETISSLAPVRVIAKMQGGEELLSALKDVYGDPVGAKLSSVDIDNIVTRQQAFVKAGMEKQEATKQAVAAVKMQKTLALTERMGAGDTAPFETTMKIAPGGISMKVTTPELESAWRMLGSPATEEEAIANYRSLAHSAHPDVPGGSTEAMTNLNKAFATIKENGLPGDMVYGPKAEIAPEEAMPSSPTEEVRTPGIEPTSKTPTLDELVKPENEKGLTAPSEKYMKAFNASNNQVVLAKIGGTEFALGDIGANHFDNKAAEGKGDRLSLRELKATLPHLKEAYNGSTDETNHRSNTAAWVANMPNGDQRVVYTKENRFGQEEVTSAHSVSKGEFVKTLKENGIPPGNRTQILPLEPASPNPLNERDTTTLAQGQSEVKLRDTYAAHPKANDELKDIWTQLEIAEHGRITLTGPKGGMVGEERKFISEPSTFPDWIPEGLRSRKLFDKVMGGLKDVSSIKYPPANNTAQRTLYDEILGYLDKQLGIDTSAIRNDIIKANGKKPEGKIAETHGGGAPGSPSRGEIKPEEVFPEKAIDGGAKAKPRESLVMASGFDPGLDKFITEDVKPAVRGAGEGFMKFLQEAKHLISPKAGASTKSLDLVFKMKGARDKAEAMLDLVTQKIEKSFDKMSEKDQIAFIDRVKRGEAQPTKELQAVADFIRSVDDETYREVQKYKPAAAWKENHYRVLWKVVPGSPETKGFKGLFRRPLQGSKGFLKHATLIDMSEGLAKGGIPYSYNPITMFKNAYADEMHFITAQRMWEAFKDNGLAKFVKTGGQRPDGFVRLNDTIAKVYFKADTEGGGNVLAQGGEWFVEENIGRVLNNFLSADKIRASALGRGMMAIKNATTAVELSLSAFHFTFETIEAASSKMALGIRESYNIGLLQKNPAIFFKGLKDIVTSFTSPKSTFTAGRRFLSMMRDAEGFKASPAGQKFLKQFPSAQDYIDDFFTGGGKLKMAKDYEINMQKAFMQNLASGNYIGATLRAVPAALKVMMTPLFDIYIPGLKMGMFMQEFPLRLQEKTNDLASGKVTRAQLARETVDFIENRLGEMNFDNLMWNRTFKTGLQFFFRSVTWKLGNIRAFGNNALLEQAKELQAAWREGRPPQISTGMAWVFSLAIYTALISTIAMKLLTGKYPTQLKDLVYPQSDPNDPTKRLSVPTYMRDGFSAANSPINYVLSSTSGEIGRMIDVWENKDFYGTEIYNQADPFYSKALAAALHLTPIPFSISSMVQPGPKTQKAIGFFGFTQAPAYITKDPLQQKISALYQTRFGGGTQTQQATDAAKAKTAIRNAYYAGDDTQANSLLQNAIKKGYITEKGAKTFVGDSDQPGDVRAFGRFDAPDQDMLLRDMTVDQLERYAWEAKPDVRDSLGDLSPNAKKFVALVKSGELKKPVWKRGEIQTTQ